MNLINNIRAFLKPTFIGMGIFLFLACLFFGAYIFVDYKLYLSNYQKNQQIELEDVQQQSRGFSKKIMSLLASTKERILNSPNDFQRIQNILNSSPYLYTPQDLPRFRSVSFTKTSDPKMLVNRLGIISVNEKNIPSNPETSMEDGLVYENKAVFAKTSVRNHKGYDVGILEIKMDTSDVIDFLMKEKHFIFGPNKELQPKGEVVLQKEPFVIYGKSPLQFVEFLGFNIKHYTVFVLFIIVCLLFFILCAAYLNRQFYEVNQKRIKSLKSSLSKASADMDKLKEALVSYERKQKLHQVSCLAINNVQSNLNVRKKEALDKICRSLLVLEEGLVKASVEMSSEQLEEHLLNSLKSARSLAKGLLVASRTEIINFEDLLNKVEAVFVEKTHKSALRLKVTYHDSLVFYGDPVFIEFIILNMLGRAVHISPKHEEITVDVSTPQDGFKRFKLRYKKFLKDDSSETLLKKTYDFIISEEDLLRMCLGSGFTYKSSTDENGDTVTEFVIPTTSQETTGNNVVSLFKGG